MTSEPILRVVGLTKHFRAARPLFRSAKPSIRAVDGVSFALREGETLALVGETGCGKSTIARCLVRLAEPTGGEAYLDGSEIFSLSKRQFRKMRQRIQMIFQDPYSSLDPRRTAGDLISEAWTIHSGLVPQSERRSRSGELLELVGLNRRNADRYPHQLSGGQRQRVAIARALAPQPSIVVCDEPVSALDASIQAQILNLLKDLQSETRVSYLFITHDLAVAAHMADSVAVMYLGQIVESGSATRVFASPRHPYTAALVSDHPVPNPWDLEGRRRIVLPGEVPSAAEPPVGCRFRERCWLYQELGNPAKCVSEEPPLLAQENGSVACHFTDKMESASRPPRSAPSDDLAAKPQQGSR